MVYSTEQAAQQVGISYITLRRWLASGRVEASIAIPARDRILWGWTDADIKMLRRFKDENYWGRPAKKK